MSLLGQLAEHGSTRWQVHPSTKVPTKVTKEVSACTGNKAHYDPCHSDPGKEAHHSALYMHRWIPAYTLHFDFTPFNSTSTKAPSQAMTSAIITGSVCHQLAI